MASKSTAKTMEILGLKAVEVERLMKDKKIVIGTEKTLKNLKLGKLKKVYIALNCPEINKRRALHYAKLAGVDAKEVEVSNKELGLLLKKPFNIAMFGIMK